MTSIAEHLANERRAETAVKNATAVLRATANLIDARIATGHVPDVARLDRDVEKVRDAVYAWLVAEKAIINAGLDGAA